MASGVPFRWKNGGGLKSLATSPSFPSENDYKCTNARIYVHEKALSAIHHPHPLDYRYVEDYIEDGEQNGQLETITEDQTIVPGISVMHTPAHTAGGLTVLINKGYRFNHSAA